MNIERQITNRIHIIIDISVRASLSTLYFVMRILEWRFKLQTKHTNISASCATECYQFMPMESINVYNSSSIQ